MEISGRLPILCFVAHKQQLGRNADFRYRSGPATAAIARPWRRRRAPRLASRRGRLFAAVTSSGGLVPLEMAGPGLEGLGSQRSGPMA